MPRPESRPTSNRSKALSDASANTEKRPADGPAEEIEEVEIEASDRVADSEEATTATPKPGSIAPPPRRTEGSSRIESSSRAESGSRGETSKSKAPVPDASPRPPSPDRSPKAGAPKPSVSAGSKGRGLLAPSVAPASRGSLAAAANPKPNSRGPGAKTAASSAEALNTPNGRETPSNTSNAKLEAAGSELAHNNTETSAQAATTAAPPSVAHRSVPPAPPPPPRPGRAVSSNDTVEILLPEFIDPPPLPPRSIPASGRLPSAPPPSRAVGFSPGNLALGNQAPLPPAPAAPPRPPSPQLAAAASVAAPPAVAESIAAQAPASSAAVPPPLPSAKVPPLPGVSHKPNVSNSRLFEAGSLNAPKHSRLEVNDALPTQYDFAAGERHASPWTQEKRAETHASNAKRLLELFESQLAKPGERLKKPRIHFEAARLYESPSRDLEAAARHYEQAVKLAKAHAPSIRGARRVMLTLKKHKAALRLFDAELELVSDAPLRAALLSEKAQLLAGPLGQRTEARDALRAAAALAPSDVSLLSTSALFEEQAGAWEEFVRALEAAASAETTHLSERATFLAHAARAAYVQLKAPERALELYKAAFDADPSSPGVLASLKDLLSARKRWHELVDVLSREATLATAPEGRAFAYYQMARILLERLSDTERGAAALEQARALTPSDRIVLEELRRVYLSTANFEHAAATIEQLLSLEVAPSVDQFQQLGELYELHLGNAAFAIERYSQALAVNPTFRPSLLALSRLREARGEWQELSELLEREADAQEDLEVRATLHARIAELLEDQLGNQAHAIDHHQRALALRPGFEPSFKALLRLHSAGGRWFDVIELYERGLEVFTTSSERIAALFSIGRLQEDALSRPGLALKTYRRILQLDGSNLEAIHALQRAAERAGEHREHIAALDLEIARGEPKARILALKHQAARILWERVGEVDAAAERFQQLLTIDAAFAPAIASLCELYQRNGQHSELLRTYEKELGITRQPAARTALLMKMADLCHRELQPEQAVAYYRRALQADDKHLGATRALRQLMLQLGDFVEGAKLFATEAELVRVTQPKYAARLEFFQGEIYEHRLEATDKALACYQRALALDPALRAAEDGCLRLLSMSLDYKQLDETLAQQVARATEPAVAQSLAYRRAELQRDRLKQPAEAAKTLEGILGTPGGHGSPLLALVRLYSLSDNHEALKRTLQRQVEVAGTPQAAIAAHRGLLALAQRTDETDAERERYSLEAILRLAPSDKATLFALERVALTAGDMQLLTQVDSKLVASDLDPSSIAAYQTRLAETLEAGGDNTALELYRAALANDPESLAAARGISRMAERLQAPLLLAEAAEREAKLLERPEDAARLLVLAASRLAAGGDIAASVQQLARALEIYPDDPRSPEALVALAARGVPAEYVTNILSTAAANAAQRERRAALWVHSARLHFEQRDDVGAATAACQRAIREQPTYVEAQALLSQLYAASKKWKECVDVLQDLLKLNPTAEIRFEALVQLATVQHDQLHSPGAAATHLATALALQPDSRVALALLLRVQIARDDLRNATTTAQKLVELSSTAEERAEALFHSARLERKRGDSERAIEAYAAAIAIAGPTAEATSELRAYLATLPGNAHWQAFTDALSSYQQRAELGTDARVGLHLDIGRVLFDRLQNYDAALKELSAAVALKPNDLKLHAELAERAERAKAYGLAVTEYQHLVAQAPSTKAYWRSISNCFTSLNKPWQAAVALAPLLLTREASAEEQRRYNQIARNPADLGSAVLRAEELRQFEAGGPVAAPVVELLSALAVVLPKIFPIQFESYGVTPRDKIPARAPHPIRNLAERIAGILGVAEFDLFVHSQGRPLVSVEFADVPTLFVHADVALRPRAEQIMLLARALFNIGRGTQLVDVLSAVDLEILLAATVRNYEPSFRSEVASPDILEQQARRVAKAMPWFKGNRVEPAARSYAGSSINLQQWILNSHVSSVRAAALLADDVVAGLSLLAGPGVDDRFIERVTSFLLSDTAVALRRRALALS